jgi:putative spermidine/putrescine transport system permease protein
MFGLGVVYTFFQIPLMVLIFLPALDNLQPQWQEASANLGGGSWAYWRHVAGPILAPSFISALLLLFVSSFSAYATAAALLSQGDPIVPLQIRTFISSEVMVGQANMGKALALGMVVVVAVVMTIYALLQRSSKWRVQ